MKEHTIIFTTNLQGDPTEGVQLASQLAAQQAATLIFLHVIPVSTQDGEGMLHFGLDLISSNKEKQLRALVPTDSGVPYRHIVRVGEPLTEIVEAVQEEGADMLVLPVQKRAFWRRFWGLDLWQQIQYKVSCPVVTYRPKSVVPLSSPPWRRESFPPEILSTLLNARTDALLSWLSLQLKAVQMLSQRQSIQDAIVSLIQGQRWSQNKPFLRQIKAELQLELGDVQMSRN